MLQFPYGVYPEGQAIDGELDNTFFCTISGTICTAYQISIYENSTNKLLYTGNKIDVTKYNQEVLNMNVQAYAFENGNNLMWSARLWTDAADMFVASNQILEVNTEYNISIPVYSTSRIKAGQKIIIGNNEYIIRSYSIDEYTNSGTIGIEFDKAFENVSKGDTFKIYSDFIDTPYYFFKSRTIPEISIVDMPTEINARNYNFTGSYFQLENTPIQYYTFNLYNEDLELIDTTDKVYSANIVYNFDGFTNNRTYYIELLCNNQDLVEISTGKREFLVNYFEPNVDVTLDYEILEDKDAIRVILKPDKTSIPEFNGEYSIESNFPFEGTNSVDIKTGTIVYDNISEEELSIDENSYTVFMSTRLNNGFEGKIVELSNDTDNRSIELQGYSFYDNKNGVINKISNIYTTDKFVLQSEQESDVGYVWDNSAVWDNSKYWWFPKENLDSKQFKITILPTSSTVLEVE